MDPYEPDSKDGFSPSREPLFQTRRPPRDLAPLRPASSDGHDTFSSSMTDDYTSSPNRLTHSATLPHPIHAITPPTKISRRYPPNTDPTRRLLSITLPNRRKSSTPSTSHSKKRRTDEQRAHSAMDSSSTGTKPALRLPLLRSVMMSDSNKGGLSERYARAVGGVSVSTPMSPIHGSAPPTASSSLEHYDPSQPEVLHSAADYERSLHLKTGEDAISFFARHGNNTPVKFVYCNAADDGTQLEYRPYDLVVVSRKQVAPEYFTVSASGVVHVKPSEASEFISLADWMHQSHMYNILRSIRFFRHYLIIKMFQAWRSNVRYRLYCKQRKQLRSKLFLARPSFCEPLLDVNKYMYELDQIQVTDVRAGVYLSDKFIKDQSDARTLASKKFELVLEKLQDVVERVCRGVKDRARQYDHRIANDDLSNTRFAQHLLGGNGRIKSMVAIKKERADRLRQLKHANYEADLLGDFIRLVDYIEVEHLVQRATSTTADFLHTLLTSHKPLFQTTVSFGTRTLQFSPTAREIHQIVAAMHEGTISTVDTVERILYHPKFKPFVSPLVTDSPRVARIIHHDEPYATTRHAIDDKISQDFVTVEHTISFLEKHRPVYEFGQTWDLEVYSQQEHTVESIQRDMLQQTEWATNIKRIRDVYDAGIFEAETRALKTHLLPITSAALAGMKQLLLRIFHRQVSELKDQYHAKIKALDEDPTQLPQYAAHVELFAKIKVEAKEMAERAKKIEAMHRLMLDYEMQTMIPSQDEVAFDDLLSAVKAFDTQVLITEQRHEDKLLMMRQTVYKHISRLNNELEAQKGLLEEGIFADEKAVPKDVVKALEQVKLTLDDIQQQTVTLQGYQVLFDTEPYPFHLLPATIAVYEKKLLFWSMYQDWLDKTKAWNNADFFTLDVEKMDQEVQEAYMTAFRLNKEATDHAVTQKLKTMIGEWKSIMPMLLELGNRAIKPTHWRTLFGALGQTYYPNEKIKLKKLRTMNMFSHRQLITDIAEQAVGEYALQTALAKIQKLWSTQELNVVPYQKTKDVFILGDVDEVMARLEEHQAQLQTMLGSPFIQAVQQEMELWDKKLSFLSEVLDEWLSCQRSYIYLEPLFSSSDIQRQLPLEAKMFADCDRFWREMMRKCHANPIVMHAVSAPGILAQFIKANKEMERIQKHLEEYLETKRAAFPRFYFLSNDEMLSILSKAKDPQAVQPHLRKCFDNIASLTFTSVPGSIEVTGMVSAEGEPVPFLRPIFTRGATEAWLTEVEQAMRLTIKQLIKQALQEYPEDALDRRDWLLKFPSQPILCVDQIMWTTNASRALRALETGVDNDAMTNFLTFSKRQIAAMVEMVRGPLSPLVRQMMSSLIILDVHARDVVESMVTQNCSSRTDFEWQKQLRYYWQNAAVEETENKKSLGPSEFEDCIVKQTNAEFKYRYEYLGNATRLVITPLTDKAYLTLTGALHLHYGGAPAGPAGTGKTETVKDLAKVVAIQVVVFNCSEGLQAKMMARYFAGLAQCGAWACFDEFNRIDIEVLSVIAQQILTIQQAVSAQKQQFEFDGQLIPLDPAFGVFVTMNPGYAGRTELPDNLKALFRPVSMMVPDYAMIAQIILFSEGFQTATSLSKKMVQLYKLASEQLSKQDHYDFGMRAVKSVLVMAGQLKRNDRANIPEDVLLIRSMLDANIPKFLSQDLPLFRAIISDLFPGVTIPDEDYGELHTAIEAQLDILSYQKPPSFMTKIIQLYETMIVRHGVMLVGATTTGKTTVSKVLAKALTAMATSGVDHSQHPFIREVQRYVLNPKSITMGELYGQINQVSLEWVDGLVAWLVRKAVSDETTARKWIIFDGPVDALWIENMNTVLDDSKMLCLNNGERIKLSNDLTMLFEVEDLAVASPATVSRCGMVYLEPIHLGWQPIIDTWRTITSLDTLFPDRANFIVDTYKSHFGAILTFVREQCTQLIPCVDSNLVNGCLQLTHALLLQLHGYTEITPEDTEYTTLLYMHLFHACIWSFGANLHDTSRSLFSTFIRQQLGTILAPNFPLEGDVYDYAIDMTGVRWMSWHDRIPPFHYDPHLPYHSLLVPTEDTTKLHYFLHTLVQANRNVLIMGETGTGKSVIVSDFLRQQVAMTASLPTNPTATTHTGYVSLHVMFSAQTSSRNLQDVLETKLERKRKNLYGAPVGKRVILFVDDLNMPSPEAFGASPPLELLRQAIDSGGFYHRTKLFFNKIQDIIYVGACAPPGGGRNVMSQRLTRHFHHIWQPLLAETSLKKIFNAILGGFLSHTADHWVDTDLTRVAHSLVDASVDLYGSIKKHMLPTPSKSFYTFNLRDLSKLIQGICMIERKHLPDVPALLRLWLHEASRVFRDRLVDDNDTTWFDQCAIDRLTSTFDSAPKLSECKDLLYGDFATSQQEERTYQAITNGDKVIAILEEQLQEYNLVFSNQMHLVFFNDAIAHFARVARILRQPRGNALLVGVGGSGRQSLTRLAAFIAGYKCVSLEITRNYGIDEWRTSLKKVLEFAGADNKPVCFLLSDTHIVHESFLEDINNLLNSGEVPNLYEHDEVEQIVMRVRPLCKAAGKSEARDSILSHFVQLVRENLHIVLAFSPIGDTFRSRCRRYPSLVNCCTMDWYNAWPQDALYSVADRFLSDKQLGLDQYKDALCRMCVKIHTSVADITPRYFRELRRHNYTTPTSYLELLKLYISMLLEQRESVTSKIMKYRNGLSRLISTNKLVEELKADLIKLQPVLKKASEETAALLIDLERDQKEANDTAAICARDAQQCKETTRQVQVIKDDCQLDLDEAMPAYEASIKQLDTLKKEHITIIKSFPHPPKPVQRVMEAVCILFGVGTTWDDAKRLLSKVKFLEMCKEYDKDHIPKATMKKLQKYIQDPEFVPSKLESVSEAAVGLCMWVRAMDVYSRVLKAVAPKRKALEAAEATLQQAQETLAAKQLSLRVVEARVAGLQSKYRTKQSERDELQQSIERTKVQLVRAEKLMSGLGSEEKRWDEQAQALNADLSHLVGNIMLSAGCIAYCGPFTASYRQELISDWNRFCVRLSLPVDDHFNLTKTLADPLVVRKWQIMGLPADQHSTENGIFVTRGRRWPLMIDPQSQANRWIKTLGKRDNLQVIRLSDPNYLRVLENAIRYGQPVLLENVEEKLDAAIEPVLQKQIFKKGGQYLLRLNDQDVPFSHEFRLYITTKLSNPSYSAEFFVKVTIINFTVTPKGLEDQLLMVVCSMERADLEQKNDRYIVQISDDRNELAVIEDRILDMLSESKGNILENEQLINALAASKQTSLSITQRMQEAEETLKTIHQVREEYRVVATRASVLYFTVADLARIDPMYQYSLLYFTNLYRQRIAESPANEHLPTRLQTLLKDLVQSIYINICRGLFEKDKLLFSFLIAVQIGRNAGTISEQEWSYFVRGADQPIKNIPPNPVKWLSTATWTDLVNGLPSFVHICDDLKDETKAEAWHKYTTSFSTDQTHVMPDPWQHTLTPFQRLLVLKILRKDRVISGIKDFVYTQLGPRFIKSPPFDLKAVYQSSTPKTPVVFILSPGANPMSYLLRLAREKNMEEQRFRHISLGQGQGAIAQEMMEAGRRDGDWICLQNAHLAASWLPTLEKLLEAHSLSDTHEDYRLFITSMPTEQFPVAILQNSIKIVNEAPKGLANNLMRTFLDIQEEEWEASSQPIAYKKLLFSLAFFHAVLQERRRYGPVGWNIPYEWSASDLDVSKKHLWMYLEESNGTVPWKTLTEIIGGVNYAGRVTDDKDQRCVYSLLSRCFTPELLTTENFPLSESGTYYCPPAGKLSAVREYIASLPDDVPEVFGLHQNADVTFQLNETRTLLETVVAIQPRASVGTSSNASAGATSQDAIVLELAGSLETRLPALLDRKYAHVTTFADIETGGNTLGVFLGQEMDRFNKLLTVIRSTLVDLQRAIRGVFVMSGELEAMFSCLLYNQVPARWERHAYPSMKALGSWFDDLIERVSFMDNWLRNGPPTAFWLSGFFFPQGFLTGVLQKYARQTHTPIDTLRFQSHVMKTMDPKQAKAPEKGALIYGLHLQGASFDVDKSVVVESAPGVLFVNMPLIWLEPVSVDEPVPSLTYLCPTYKTSKRAGVLATTGHSTNFVLNLHLSTEVEPDHWIRRGVAMLLSLD